MYKLIIGKSKSTNFQKALDLALFLGGSFDGNKITLSIDEDMKAYTTFFPLFNLNVLSWKNTRAYHNGNQVDPYRFMFKMDQKRTTFYADVLEQLEDSGFSIPELLSMNTVPKPYLYIKRENNTFYFQGEKKAFNLTLNGKRLYEFVDKYDVGDIVYFE